MEKNIGLFFGSFNPVHMGHLIIAEYMYSRTELTEVWMVLSPHNPLKKRASLASDNNRLHLLHLALDDHYKIKPSKVEFTLPKPSYTIDTLTYLIEKYPDYQFHLIMGSDNINTLHKWKNYEEILSQYKIEVYQRVGAEAEQFADHPSVSIHDDVPMMNISSSYIRARLAAGESIKFLVNPEVEEYIIQSRMYK